MGKGAFGGAAGKSGGHGKAGSTDKGKSNIDKSGRTGRHHGGFLSGSSRNDRGGRGGGGSGKGGAADGLDRHG